MESTPTTPGSRTVRRRSTFGRIYPMVTTGVGPLCSTSQCPWGAVGARRFVAVVGQAHEVVRVPASVFGGRVVGVPNDRGPAERQALGEAGVSGVRDQRDLVEPGLDPSRPTGRRGDRTQAGHGGALVARSDDVGVPGVEVPPGICRAPRRLGRRRTRGADLQPLVAHRGDVRRRAAGRGQSAGHLRATGGPGPSGSAARHRGFPRGRRAHIPARHRSRPSTAHGRSGATALPSRQPGASGPRRSGPGHPSYGADPAVPGRPRAGRPPAHAAVPALRRVESRNGQTRRPA